MSDLGTAARVGFQPTRPLRGATYLGVISASVDEIFQPTRPLRGATTETVHKSGFTSISTHAPLAGRDDFPTMVSQSKFAFQPTRPLRGATVGGRIRVQHTKKISTHAPLAGRDFIPTLRLLIMMYFNPRAPCGARRIRKTIPAIPMNFNPRAPCGARRKASVALKDYADFNPRAPCGARQQKCTNHYAHFCDNRQISDAFAQNAACQGILLLFDAGKPCGFWVRTAQVVSARLCFAL